MTHTSDTTHLAYLTASELAARYATRELSPVDVTPPCSVESNGSSPS